MNPNPVKIICGVILLGAAATAAAQPTVGPNGDYYESFLNAGSITWATAVTEAQTQTMNFGGTTIYGELAPITDAALSTFANSLILSDYGPSSGVAVWNGDYANDGIVYAEGAGSISDTSWVTWVSGADPSTSSGQTGNYGIVSTGEDDGYDWQVFPPSVPGASAYLVEFPVPEPSSLALTALGGLGGLLRLRRRK